MALLESIRPSWWITSEERKAGVQAQKSGLELVKTPRVKTIISGTFGGISLITIGHPFDTVKVKLQTQGCVAAQAPLYSGAIDCARKTVKSEGLGGLYKGIGPPLIGQVFKSACLFTTHDEVKTAIMARNGGKPLTAAENFVAGAMGGGVVALVETPTEMFKSKMQAQQSGSSVRYASTLDCVRQVTRTSGLRGWYQGFGASALTCCTANGLFFAGYFSMRQWLDPHEERKPLPLFLSGASAGVVFTTLIFPLDTIKSTLMADNSHATHRQYNGVIDCAKKLYARQGFRAFTQGIAPSLLRATPGLGMLVVTVETCKKTIEGL
mmetsp:Transcript_7211/g.16971  ORF Transcript_7211/g.16971 Transcript_7211/m.16971 type:complete len:323 (-) Transcript_7211:49-1017(-)